MSIISWNCRGLGNSPTVRELGRLIRTQNPNIIFLCETKCSSKLIEKIKLNMNLFGVSVPSKGKSGGLALLWKKDWNVQIRKLSQNFIDAVVYDKDDGTWRITGVYGFPETNRRSDFWCLLKRLSLDAKLPWCVLGDFNEILEESECQGGRDRPRYMMKAFREAVNFADLVDLIPEGYPFTWAKNWKFPNSYRARLDRALMDRQMIQSWPKSKILHVDTNHSDHLPIKLILLKQSHHQLERKKLGKRFRFESMWASRPEVKEIVNKIWSQNGNSLAIKLKQCRMELLKWSKTSFGNIFKEADRLRQRIAELKFNHQMDNVAHEIENLQKELDDRLNQQDLMWKQRSKELWHKSGDRNTNYFHNKASKRAKANSVEGLMKEDGTWVDNFEEIKDMVEQHFKNLFTSDEPSLELINSVIERISPVVTDELREILEKDFTTKEVYDALFSMNPLKAPGPDGYNPQFYQKFWGILGEDFAQNIIQMLSQRSITEDCNQTTIVLIPKSVKPKELSQLRPISLCNVTYRVASKMLANRIKLDAMICKKITGVNIGKDGPQICHLMFADDTVLFGEATVEEAKTFIERLISMTSIWDYQLLRGDQSSKYLPASKKEY